MGDVIRIPDDVFENRCRWCVHRIAEQNRDVERWETHTGRESVVKTLPCRILGIVRPGEIPGECGSFSPHNIYGICATCEHDNMFHDGFCLEDNQPNKRQVYIGEGYQRKEYWGVHRLSTCDGYTPDPRKFERMRNEAAEGLIPQNFDPETMKPIEETKKNEVAEMWTALENATELAKAVKKAERERIAAELNGQIYGQISMEDLI